MDGRAWTGEWRQLYCFSAQALAVQNGLHHGRRVSLSFAAAVPVLGCGDRSFISSLVTCQGRCILHSLMRWYGFFLDAFAIVDWLGSAHEEMIFSFLIMDNSSRTFISTLHIAVCILTVRFSQEELFEGTNQLVIIEPLIVFSQLCSSYSVCIHTRTHALLQSPLASCSHTPQRTMPTSSP